MNQPIGYQKIGEVGKRIAAYLELPNPEKYTGHVFRTTSATFAAEAGCSVPQIQQIGTWKSSRVAANYVQNSDNNRKKLAEMLTKNMNTTATKINNSSTSTGTGKEIFSIIKKNMPSTSTRAKKPKLRFDIPKSFHKELSQELSMEDLDQPVYIPLDLEDEMSQDMPIEETYSTDIPEELKYEMSQELKMNDTDFETARHPIFEDKRFNEEKRRIQKIPEELNNNNNDDLILKLLERNSSNNNTPIIINNYSNCNITNN